MAKRRADEYFSDFSSDDARYSGSYDPAPPRAPSPFGFNPSAPSGPLEGLLQTLTPMLSEMARKQFGGIGFTFGSDMNVRSAQYAREYLEQMNAARAYGAQADRGQVDDLIRGIAVAIGHRPAGMNGRGSYTFGAPDSAIERAIGRMGGDTAALLPVLAAMFPDTIDQILPRGSLTAAATQFVSSGRFVTDPLTGRPLSERADYAAAVLQPLLDGGPKETAGLGANRLAGIYGELARRGMIDNGEDLRRQVEDFGASSGMMGMSGADARDVQAGRAREKIKQYTETVAAINDIFTANGQKDASMPELIRAIQSMTGGGFQTMSPEQLRSSVRTLHGLTLTSGMSFEGMQVLASDASRVLAATGARVDGNINSLVTYGAGANAVARARGYGATGPNTISNDQFVQLVTQTQAAFAGSDVGNLVGAVSALGDYVGEDTELGQLAKALRAGKTGTGKFDIRGATLADISGIATRSGLGADAVVNQLRARNQNQAQFVGREGLQGVGPALQRADFEQYLMADAGRIGALGTDPRKLLDALYAEAGNADVKSGADLAARVGARFGWKADKIQSLGSLIGEFGQMRGLPDGQQLVRMFAPEFQKAVGEEIGRGEAKGQEMREVQDQARGSWGRLVSGAFARMGKGMFTKPDGTVDIVDFALAGLGRVQDPNGLLPPPDQPAGPGFDAVLGGWAGAAAGATAKPGANAQGMRSGGPVDVRGVVSLSADTINALRGVAPLNAGGAVRG